VIGSAFIWRTAARTAIGLAPPPVSALPKAAIAYFGTYTVGQAARYYYERGDRPTPEVLRAFQADARRLYANLNDALKRRLTGGRGMPARASPPSKTEASAAEARVPDAGVADASGPREGAA
jgi:hypothetical protein